MATLLELYESENKTTVFGGGGGGGGGRERERESSVNEYTDISIYCGSCIFTLWKGVNI